MAKNPAAPREYVQVNAMGEKRRPSWACSVKTGRKATVMIMRLKNRAGPTSAAAS